MNRAVKNVLRIAAIVVSCMMLMSLFGAVQTKVLAGEETTYTVRILPGAKGTMTTQVYTGLHYGDKITVYVNPNAVNDDKYYAKGLKDSGMDNNDPVSDFIDETYLQTDGVGNWTITVTKDQDFVVSYGLQGSMVEYTVNYVNTAGATISASETFYGSIGDMPVLSYKYIDGYEPASNDLSYLQANGNVFTFVYAVIEVPTTPEPTPTPEPEPTPTPEPTPAPTPEGEGGAAGPEGEGGAAGPGGEGDLVDIGDEGTPTTANPDETPADVRTYDGFKVSTDTGLGDGPDEEGLYNIDDPDAPTTVGPGEAKDRGTKSRYAVYDAEGHIIHTYKYAKPAEYKGITAFAGSIADLIKK